MIQKIQPEDIETFTLETNPSTTFISNSNGVQGQLHVFPRRSEVEKEIYPLSIYSGSIFNDQDLSTFLKKAKMNSMSNGNNQADILNYMNSMNNQQNSLKKQQTVEIIRFTPGSGLDQNMYRKQTVVNSLFPYYRHIYPSLNYAFTNYNSLNFVNSTLTPSQSVLLYPQTIQLSGNNVVSGDYIVSGAFSFDFWIKPKPLPDSTAIGYKTGTILSLSGCYTISLLSGSSVDVNGCVNKFRLLFQLSNSANIPPSIVDINNLPNLCFVSDDNSLLKDVWHHVTIRWGTNSYNLGSGSILIDNISRCNFVVTESVLNYKTVSGSDGPSALCVGNFYEGTNSGVNAISRFFSVDAAERDGLLNLNPATGVSYPDTWLFRTPLNAEIHDIKIYNKFLIDSEILSLSVAAPLNYDNLKFYLPPFFTQESPIRKLVGSNGGIFVTPFQTKNGTTTTPFSSELSYEVGAHYLNLENFTREFVKGTFPRLIGLTGSIVSVPGSFPTTANSLLYATASNKMRNLIIQPCDNGNFFPNFQFLTTLSSSYFHNDLYNEDLSLISLRDLYPTSSLFSGLNSTNNGSILNDLMGPNPDDTTTLGNSAKYVPTILQRTRDNTSNQVVFFDISTLYYDQNIEPNTFTLVNVPIPSFWTKTSMILKDDGYGNIYRADATGSCATWNSVGNILYNEGIILLKHPSLYFFGENEYFMSFKGRHNIHILKINCAAPGGLITSSSNPNYIQSLPSQNVNQLDEKYVWITDVLLHDENLNVISRTKLAQHFLKRHSDSVVFKVSIDF